MKSKPEKEAQKAGEEMAETAPPVEAPGPKKKKPNRLLVEEATNDDNSVVALNTATMEELCVRAAPSAPSPARPLSRAGRTSFARALATAAHGWVSAAAATSSAVTP